MRLTPPTTPPFTREALALLFERRNFKSFQKDGYPSHYWAPLLSVCSGMRRNEIFFLTPDDVLQQEGIWLVRIRASEARPGALGSASRDIPLHPLLLKLGFPDFVQTRHQTHAGERLFSEYRAIQQQAGVPFSRAFVQWIKTTVDRLPAEHRHLFADDYHFPSLRALFTFEASRSGMSGRIFANIQGSGEVALQPRDDEQKRRDLHQAAAEMARMEIESYFPGLFTYDELLT